MPVIGVDGTKPNQTQSTSDLRYRAVYAKLEKRYSHRSLFLFSYTHTRSNDNAPLARYLDPFNPALDWVPSNGERRHAVVASGSLLLPYDVTLGLVWTARSQLPWSAVAGKDLNKDGFVTDLVPGTTRNSGNRNLDLDAVNAYRAANGLPAVTPSMIASSALSLADMRISKNFSSVVRGDRRRVRMLHTGENR